MKPVPTRKFARTLTLALTLTPFFSPVAAAAQDPAQLTPKPAIAQPPSITIHYAGPGVVAPVLYPPSISIVKPRRCFPVNGVVKLSAVIDENGVPRSIQTLHSDDLRLDDLAIGLAAQQRFKPGTFHGVPAAIAIDLTAALHTCASPPKHGSDSFLGDPILNASPFFAFGIRTGPREP